MREFEIVTTPKYRDLGFWAKSEAPLTRSYDNEGYLVLRVKRIKIGYITPIGKDIIGFTLRTRKQFDTFKYIISGHIHFYKATIDFITKTEGELICSSMDDYVNQIKDMLEIIITAYYKNFKHGGRP